jgi:hypothetical protein
MIRDLLRIQQSASSNLDLVFGDNFSQNASLGSIFYDSWILREV